MSQTIIRVAGIGKRYRLGAEQVSQSFRGMLNRVATAPFRGVRSMGKKNISSDPTEFWALRDVSFEVNQGDVVALIGRNGSGKSTLLKILSRITEPTTGRIELKGRVGSLLEVGTGFHPELTGRENIFLNGAILGMTRSEIRRKFDEIVSFAEVAKFVDTPVKHYSSGMYLRLAFSVAAHLESEILIVDEVLAVGDAAFQKKCLGRMREASQGGRTVLFVSHNMTAVRTLTTKGVVLRQGRVDFVGDTPAAINYYLNNLEDLTTDVYEIGVHGFRPRGYSRVIEFVSLRLCEHTNKMLEHDQDIVMLIELHANETIPRFRLNCTFLTKDGTSAGTGFTPENLSMRKGQTSVFEFRMRNLNLAPGSYYSTLALGTGNPDTGVVDFDVIESVVHFEVLGQGTREGITPHWNPYWGGVRFPETTALEQSTVEQSALEKSNVEWRAADGDVVVAGEERYAVSSGNTGVDRGTNVPAASDSRVG